MEQRKLLPDPSAKEAASQAPLPVVQQDESLAYGLGEDEDDFSVGERHCYRGSTTDDRSEMSSLFAESFDSRPGGLRRAPKQAFQEKPVLGAPKKRLQQPVQAAAASAASAFEERLGYVCKQDSRTTSIPERYCMMDNRSEISSLAFGDPFASSQEAQARARESSKNLTLMSFGPLEDVDDGDNDGLLADTQGPDGQQCSEEGRLSVGEAGRSSDISLP